MKQMQEIGVQPDFTLTAPGRMESTIGRWLERAATRLRHLASRRRELLASAAATCAIGLALLLASYLFLVQLAAHGW